MNGFLRRIWGKFGIDRVASCDNGVFLVRFRTRDAREQALAAGPFMFDRKPVITKRWSSDLKIREEKVSDVPIWVRLPNLDLKFWGREALMKIAGLIGNLVKTDKVTAQKERIAYARIMIEVEINGKLPDFIEFLDEEGNRIKQSFREKQKIWRPVQRPMQTNHGPKGEAMPGTGKQSVQKPVQKTVQVMQENTDIDQEGTTVLDKQGQQPTDSGQHHNIGLFGLIETKVKAKKFGKVFESFRNQWSVITNYSKVDKGRIWIIWQPTLFLVQGVRIESQCIHTHITHKATGVSFWCTMVYGLNVAIHREELWCHMQEISATFDDPWVVCGDFNNILNLGDRIGSPCCLNEVEKFRDCLRHCGLIDFKTGGSFFTYTNKQQGSDRVCTKIDRVLVNEKWYEAFNNTTAVFLPEGLMDHCPCIISMLGETENFSDIEIADTVAAKELQSCQEKLCLDPGNENLIQDEYVAREKYDTAHKAKFQFLRQKAKLHWLKEGDVNSAYFRACLRSRRVHNRVTNINVDGVTTQDPSLIANAFIEYYKGLLGTSSVPQQKVHPKVIEEGVVLNTDQHAALCRRFGVDDVKKALWSIDEDKAPEPDGFSSKFFKTSWEVVKEDLCKAVLGFFDHGNLLKQVCTTTLTLIPKVENATLVTQFRPIACCNVIYKIISKMICSRLKEVLPAIIDECQGAFVTDDLMLFTYGDRNSVGLIFRALNMFNKVSGLQANSEKTAIYFGNVDDSTKASILNFTGFVEGSTPFKYLGVPLNSKYLKVADFDVLIDKMLHRSCVLLPKTVIQRINQLCRDFLWCGSAILSKAPPIAWANVCMEKKFGGLGIRDCESWNKAALGKYIWQIAKKKDSLWVKWVHNVYIKNQDWWSYKPKKADGWAWKKICNVKEELSQG
ncbi:uncharacterized protein LOC110725081 [Chenopodium quinoa]|uniref:uncharacterized protein LOC110725081 n=1 Tax=Chenopodium quinoa TaxID=63459 RepID=UPI000B76FB1D|nr:uncharacterized protein LOC110725081 [Chenopodium quinoa]